MAKNHLKFLKSDREWKVDEKFRFNIAEFNKAFYESVPSLEFINWKISNFLPTKHWMLQ